MAIDPKVLHTLGDCTLAMMQESARDGLTLRDLGEKVLDQDHDAGCCQLRRVTDDGQLHRCSRPIDPAIGRHLGMHRCADGDWWTHVNAYLLWYPACDTPGYTGTVQAMFAGYDQHGDTDFVTIKDIDDARVMIETDARHRCLESIRRRAAWEWAPAGHRTHLVIPLMITDWPVDDPGMLDAYANEVRDQIERAMRARDHWHGELQNPVAAEMVTLFRDLMQAPPIPLA